MTIDFMLKFIEQTKKFQSFFSSFNQNFKLAQQLSCWLKRVKEIKSVEQLVFLPFSVTFCSLILTSNGFCFVWKM